jgi:transposase
MEEYTKLDFTGQDIYIGLDIHKKNWTVSIFTENFEHKTFSQNPDPYLLARYVKHHFPGANYHSVYEAGYCGFWIHEALLNAGIHNIVINPADVPTKDKERQRKNNRVDARKLARRLRNGDLEPIHVHNRQRLEDRFLIRMRRDAVKQQTRYKNKIKGELNFYGITIPDQLVNARWSGAFINWLATIPMVKPSGKTAFLDLVNELQHGRQRLANLNRDIRRLATQPPYADKVRLLTTIAGIGTITAMIFLTELGDIIVRFNNLDKLAAFVGLVPGENSSGAEDDITYTHITARSHHYLRAILIEAAWVAVRKDPALAQCYYKLTKRMVGQKAIIHIARKLLNRIRYVLKNNQEYKLLMVQ